jgi:uncharacterized membrane protein YoaK (UPF0700 family)
MDNKSAYEHSLYNFYKHYKSAPVIHPHLISLICLFIFFIYGANVNVTVLLSAYFFLRGAATDYFRTKNIIGLPNTMMQNVPTNKQVNA